MIGCVVVSDRGDLYLPGCLASLANAIPDTIPIRVVTGVIGLANAVRAAWEIALDEDWDHLFHVEEDFLFSAPVPLSDMQHALGRFDRLAQVVLKRQPWSIEEKAAGGIIEMHPDLYTEQSAFGRSYRISTHQRIFSLNPCLIPAWVLQMGWPDSNEAGMTERLVEQDAQFGFYGGKADPPLIEHVGAERSSTWSL